MISPRARIVALLAMIVCRPDGVLAQEGRYEVLVGGNWMGPITLQTKNAELSTSNGGSRNLFETDSKLAQTFGVEAGLGVRLTRRMLAVGSISTGSTKLTTRITDDFEGAPVAEASAALRELLIEGSVVAELEGLDRVVPFVSGGAGYLRYLDSGHAVGDPGWSYHLGAGLSYQVTSVAGIRAEARAVIRKLTAFDDELHVAPAATGLLFLRF